MTKVLYSPYTGRVSVTATIETDDKIPLLEEYLPGSRKVIPKLQVAVADMAGVVHVLSGCICNRRSSCRIKYEADEANAARYRLHTQYTLSVLTTFEDVSPEIPIIPVLGLKIVTETQHAFDVPTVDTRVYGRLS